MFSNLTKIYEKGVCGGGWGKSLLKVAPEKSFWGGIENFLILPGRKLTLDDTMYPLLHSKPANEGFSENRGFV